MRDTIQKQKYCQCDEKAAKLSASEEHEASELYEHRLREVKSEALKKILKHALKEELEHRRLFEGWLEEHEKEENGLR